MTRAAYVLFYRRRDTTLTLPSSAESILSSYPDKTTPVEGQFDDDDENDKNCAPVDKDSSAKNKGATLENGDEHLAKFSISDDDENRVASETRGFDDMVFGCGSGRQEGDGAVDNMEEQGTDLGHMSYSDMDTVD